MTNLQRKNICLLFFLCFSHNFLISDNGIYNQTFSTQLGDHIATFVSAKILSLKYNIPFYYVPFKYSDLFIFDDAERLLSNYKFKEHVQVLNEKNVIDNLYKGEVLFYTHFQTAIERIHPQWIEELRKIVQLKETPLVNPLPKDTITIAVHIRKANGGGERNEGKQISQQYFDFDRSITEYIYINNVSQFPFDWMTFIRFGKDSYHMPQGYLNMNGITQENNTLTTTNLNVSDTSYYSNYPLDRGCPIKYAPDQYYVDQIKKISTDLGDIPLFVQLFTDDINPLALLEKIKNVVNKPNITFHYHNNRDYSYRDQMAQDLYSMSRFNILIRSHSYFAKTAELMGNHTLIIFPIDFKWITSSKLVITKVIIKGNLNSKTCSILENNKIYSPLFNGKDLILHLDEKDTDGFAPLHLAAKDGNLYIIKSLIHSCADIDIQDNYGNTPLMHALTNNHNEIAKYLLAQNANINIKNNIGLTALGIAKMQENTDIIKLILK